MHDYAFPLIVIVYYMRMKKKQFSQKCLICYFRTEADAFTWYRIADQSFELFAIVFSWWRSRQSESTLRYRFRQ